MTPEPRAALLHAAARGWPVFPLCPADSAAPDARRPAPKDSGRYPVAWLHVIAAPDWNVTPSGRTWCACGHDRSATGRDEVARLVQLHNEHRTACPLRTTTTEGRAAA